MSIYFLAAAVLIVSFTFPLNVFAVSVNISNVPSTITDQPFQFNASINGAQSGVNYIRANLYQPGTTSYFGLTYNGVDYYSGSDYLQYLPVNIDTSGNWTGQVIAKLDTSASYYKGSGTYNLKVRRYTSASSYLWSNEVSLVANVTLQVLQTAAPSANPNTVPSISSTINVTSNNNSSFTVSNVPVGISSDQMLNANVNLVLPSNPNTSYYLKGAFVSSGGSNYFGQTKVGGSWVKNSTSYSSQLPITTDSSGNWNGNIVVMVDPLDSGYTGSGSYIFKVAKYSTSGSSLVWSNESIVNVNNVFIVTENPTSVSKTSATTAPFVTNQISKSSGTNVLPKSTPTIKPKVDLELPEQLLGLNQKRIGTVAGEATSSFGVPSEVIVKANLNANYLYLVGGLAVLCIGGGIIMFILQKYTGDKNDLSK